MRQAVFVTAFYDQAITNYDQMTSQVGGLSGYVIATL